MTRNQAAQPPNIIVDTKSGGNSAPERQPVPLRIVQSVDIPLMVVYLALLFSSVFVPFCFGSAGTNFKLN